MIVTRMKAGIEDEAGVYLLEDEAGVNPLEVEDEPRGRPQLRPMTRTRTTLEGEFHRERGDEDEDEPRGLDLCRRFQLHG